MYIKFPDLVMVYALFDYIIKEPTFKTKKIADADIRVSSIPQGTMVNGL